MEGKIDYKSMLLTDGVVVLEDVHDMFDRAARKYEELIWYNRHLNGYKTRSNSTKEGNRKRVNH